MSQRIRRSLAVSGLVVALFVAVPLPSQAAGWGEEAGLASFFERLWGWVETFLPGGLESSWEKEGSAIDPDGRPIPVPTSSTPGSDQGVMIDPDGLH